MEREISLEQKFLGALKREEAKLSSCLRENQCLAGDCLKGEEPALCLMELEDVRQFVDAIQNNIQPSEDAPFMSEFSVQSSQGPEPDRFSRKNEFLEG